MSLLQRLCHHSGPHFGLLRREQARLAARGRSRARGPGATRRCAVRPERRRSTAFKPSWRGLIELFVVLGFALGWAALEWYASRLDKRHERDESRGPREDSGPS